MSAPLIDFRGKVTTETHVVLESLSRATGRDKSEIALEQLHAASVMQRLAAAEKVSAAPAGMIREDEGGPV